MSVYLHTSKKVNLEERPWERGCSLSRNATVSVECPYRESVELRVRQRARTELSELR